MGCAPLHPSYGRWRPRIPVLRLPVLPERDARRAFIAPSGPWALPVAVLAIAGLLSPGIALTIAVPIGLPPAQVSTVSIGVGRVIALQLALVAGYLGIARRQHASPPGHRRLVPGCRRFAQLPGELIPALKLAVQLASDGACFLSVVREFGAATRARASVLPQLGTLVTLVAPIALPSIAPVLPEISPVLLIAAALSLAVGSSVAGCSGLAHALRVRNRHGRCECADGQQRGQRLPAEPGVSIHGSNPLSVTRAFF